MTDQQIKAMVTLLKDPDEGTADLVKKSLIGMGEEAIPSLVRAMQILDTGHRNHLEPILGEIRFTNLENAFGSWASPSEGDVDLEEGCFLLARFAYPDLDGRFYKERLDEMARAIKRTLKNVKRPQSVIQRINRYLFDEERFRGNIVDYYNPDNSYLNRVLDRKTGIPISLSVVYLLLAKRLGLPISGVGLPGHFILKYETPEFIAYIDAFHRGQILTRRDCLRFLTHSGHSADESFLMEVSHRNIMVRMIRNLAYIYKQAKAPDLVERLKRLTRATNATL